MSDYLLRYTTCHLPLLQELIFEMSDYFLCVVNDFTSLDQRYLDKITR